MSVAPVGGVAPSANPYTYGGAPATQPPASTMIQPTTVNPAVVSAPNPVLTSGVVAAAVPAPAAPKDEYDDDFESDASSSVKGKTGGPPGPAGASTPPPSAITPPAPTPSVATTSYGVVGAQPIPAAAAPAGNTVQSHTYGAAATSTTTAPIAPSSNINSILAAAAAAPAPVAVAPKAPPSVSSSSLSSLSSSDVSSISSLGTAKAPMPKPSSTVPPAPATGVIGAATTPYTTTAATTPAGGVYSQQHQQQQYQPQQQPPVSAAPGTVVPGAPLPAGSSYQPYGVSTLPTASTPVSGVVPPHPGVVSGVNPAPMASGNTAAGAYAPSPSAGIAGVPQQQQSPAVAATTAIPQYAPPTAVGGMVVGTTTIPTSNPVVSPAASTMASNIITQGYQPTPARQSGGASSSSNQHPVTGIVGSVGVGVPPTGPINPLGTTTTLTNPVVVGQQAVGTPPPTGPGVGAINPLGQPHQATQVPHTQVATSTTAVVGAPGGDTAGQPQQQAPPVVTEVNVNVTVPKKKPCHFAGTTVTVPVTRQHVDPITQRISDMKKKQAAKKKALVEHAKEQLLRRELYVKQVEEERQKEAAAREEEKKRMSGVLAIEERPASTSQQLDPKTGALVPVESTKPVIVPSLPEAELYAELDNLRPQEIPSNLCATAYYKDHIGVLEVLEKFDKRVTGGCKDVLNMWGFVPYRGRYYGLKKFRGGSGNDKDDQYYGLGLGSKATPLHFAILAGRLDVIVLLLQKGATYKHKKEILAGAPGIRELAKINKFQPAVDVIDAFEKEEQEKEQRKKDMILGAQIRYEKDLRKKKRERARLEKESVAAIEGHPQQQPQLVSTSTLAANPNQDPVMTNGVHNLATIPHYSSPPNTEQQQPVVVQQPQVVPEQQPQIVI